MNWKSISGFADDVALKSYTQFSSLPKKGKPQVGKEWTLMAAIVQSKTEAGRITSLDVVALGTGSKCIGQTKMSKKGDIVNDSHAEVLARRAFVRYLLQQLGVAYSGVASSIFTTPSADTGYRCKLRDDIHFHLFISHTPCGDASIFGKTSNEEMVALAVDSKEQAQDLKEINENKVVYNPTETTKEQCVLKRKYDCSFANQTVEVTGSATKVQKTDLLSESDNRLKKKQEDKTKSTASPEISDIYRTGAKCVPGGVQDKHQPGVDYHVTGALRIKPGRGDRTMSMSCSDKIARWNIVGCQGALLMHFLSRPIYLDSVVIGKCPYDEAAMKRGLSDRISTISGLPVGYKINSPILLQSRHQFEFSRNRIEQQIIQTSSVKLVPSSSSIIWCKIMRENSHDVIVNGKKQGVTSKTIDKPEARSTVCSVEIFKEFLQLLDGIEKSMKPISLRSPKLNTYEDYKEAAESYQESWRILKNSVFQSWLSKPREFLKYTSSC